MLHKGGLYSNMQTFDLVLKGLSWSNTIAYYICEYITAFIFFLTLGPIQLIKFRTGKLTKSHGYKLANPYNIGPLVLFSKPGLTFKASYTRQISEADLH